MMTAEQLKNSILQLAMQGKLIPQDYTDEPAQKLLKRIRETKNTLIKNKVVPKDKKMAEVSEDEQLFDIPESWVWTRIGELFQHNTGKALNGANKEGIILPYITTSNLYWNRFELDNLKEMPFTEAEMDKCTAVKGDLLVCEGGDYGRAAIWNYDFDIRIQNHVHRLRAYEELCTEYFYYVFNYLKSTGQIKGKGIAIQGLSSGALHNLPVPLPPLKEQYRIVEKIHKVLPEWNKYEAASTKLNTLNASFPEMMKKSILQEAVQGKLVPQDPNDEPASVLLKKIAEEKKRLIKEGKIRKDKKESVIFRGDDGVFYETVGKKTVCIQDQIPFSIPETWEWIRLRTYGLFSSGKTPSMANPNYWNGNIPWVTPKDMKTEIIQDSQMHISKEASEEMTIYPKGTLLMVVRSGILKRMLPLCILGIDSTINQDLKAFTFYDNELSEWIYYELKGFEHYILHNLVKNVTTVDSLKFDEFQDLLVPLPPRAEQLRIINKVKEILQNIDEITIS